MEMGIVSEFISCHQLGLVIISGYHAFFCMSYARRCLTFHFSYSLPYIEKILGTSECSWSYRPRTDMVIVSEFGSWHQLGLGKISG